MTTAEVEIRATGAEATVAALEGVTVAAEAARAALEGVELPPRVEVISEPLTYDARFVPDRTGPHGLRALSVQQGYSYVKDFVLFQQKVGSWRESEERLLRHAKEMKALGEKREAIFSPEVAYEFESRAVTWASGQGGYFAPPLWINQQFAMRPTAERVLAAQAPQFELPMGAQSVNIPRFTTGPEVQETQLHAPVPDTDIQDTAVSSAVATIAGQEDVPMQMLEQSPVGAHLDWVVFTAMEARYGAALELQLINGTGTATPQGSGNNQLLGILNNTSIPAGNIITYTDAAPSAKNMIQTSTGLGGGGLSQVVAAVGNNRKLPPEGWLGTTSRGAWITSGELAFPLALANQLSAGAFDMLAYPYYQDDVIPTNLGATNNQDIVIACRPSDWLILESERRTNVFTEVISGSLMARLSMRRYVAALLRYPSSVAYLTGSGMVVQPGF